MLGAASRLAAARGRRLQQGAADPNNPKATILVSPHRPQQRPHPLFLSSACLAFAKGLTLACLPDRRAHSLSPSTAIYSYLLQQSDQCAVARFSRKGVAARTRITRFWRRRVDCSSAYCPPHRFDSARSLTAHAPLLHHRARGCLQIRRSERVEVRSGTQPLPRHNMPPPLWNAHADSTPQLARYVFAHAFGLRPYLTSSPRLPRSKQAPLQHPTLLIPSSPLELVRHAQKAIGRRGG